MTDAMGHYIGGGKRQLPAHVIQKMKKNMKKVPIIQEKSEQYHQHEKQEADKIIEEQLRANNGQGIIEKEIKHNGKGKKENVFKKIVNYLQKIREKLL